MRQVIVAAWTLGGLLPPAAITAMVPVAEPEAVEMSDDLNNDVDRAPLRHRGGEPIPSSSSAIRRATWSGLSPKVTWSREERSPNDL